MLRFPYFVWYGKWYLPEMDEVRTGWHAKWLVCGFEAHSYKEGIRG